MASYSGLFDGVHGSAHALLTNKTGNAETMIARLFSKKSGQRAVLRELMVTLTGATAGSTAAVTNKRVQAAADVDNNVQGGARVIETDTLVNRVTTSADATRILGALQLSSQPTYPVDASGNGGGGKLS